MKSINSVLTSQEAAELLDVSHFFLLGLLASGELSFRKMGGQRRVLFADLMMLKQRFDETRGRALEELTRQAQELRMGYE